MPRNQGIHPRVTHAEVVEWFYPMTTWPPHIRSQWHRGVHGTLQRFLFWKFFWYNGLPPHLCTRWTFAAYSGDDPRNALRELRRFEAYAADRSLTERYLLRGRIQDLEVRRVINLATEKVVWLGNAWHVVPRYSWEGGEAEPPQWL
jgi:hypothetical protein